MHNAHPYPYLAHLLGAYFHQDALDDGQSADDIVRDFAETSHAYDVLGARADILRFLHQHSTDTDLVGSINRTFKPDLSIGNSDAEARAWLTRVQELLERLSEPRPRSPCG